MIKYTTSSDGSSREKRMYLANLYSKVKNSLFNMRTEASRCQSELEYSLLYNSFFVCVNYAQVTFESNVAQLITIISPYECVHLTADVEPVDPFSSHLPTQNCSSLLLRLRLLTNFIGINCSSGSSYGKYRNNWDHVRFYCCSK